MNPRLSKNNPFWCWLTLALYSRPSGVVGSTDVTMSTHLLGTSLSRYMPASLCVFKQCPIQVLTKPKVAYLECTDGNWCFQHGKATGLVLECSFSRFSVSNNWILFPFSYFLFQSKVKVHWSAITTVISSSYVCSR